MPVISRFFGVQIMMYYNEHPPPHFHVRYNSQKAVIDIAQLSVITGKIPPRILGFVIEWASLHRTELLENWNLAVKELPLLAIDPLE